MFMLLCASKFATTKIEWRYHNTFGGTIYFAVDCTYHIQQERYRSVVYAHFFIVYSHRQLNKFNPQLKCSSAHFEATLDFSRSEFTGP